eukprot:m.281716 g.281716  ORF g.281716 m.281716 type:complete len:480 (-) comp16177_c0_seq2:109-1548(-)
MAPIRGWAVVAILGIHAVKAWAWSPSPKCQAAANAFCLSSCVPKVHVNSTLARYSGPPPEMWRCYPASELDPTGTNYTSGTHYCSRDSEIRSVLKKCGDLPPSPPPSPEPNPNIKPFPYPAVPEIGRGTASTAVFWRGQQAADGTVYPCVRIPSIITAGGTLLAFAECRRSTGDGCLPTGVKNSGVRDVCMRRSVDGGRHWGNLTVIAYDSSQDTAVYDTVTKTVIVNVLGPAGNDQVVSTDLGLTWSQPRSIGLNVSSETGPGVGIQLSPSNPHAPGRLLFIGHAGAYVQDYVWYSDDHGETYKLSTTSTGDSLLLMDEAELVELENGNVLANMRNKVPHGTSGALRGIALSTDGGTSFGKVVFDPALAEPVCMGSVIRASDPTLGDGAVYFANPGTSTGRVVGLVRRSEHCTGLPPDECSWGDGQFTVYPDGEYAYSCLTPLNTTHVGLLWETNTSFCVGPSCLQVFSAIPISSFTK